ncbi:MAG: ATP-binding cassette domain-containing protein, partial [Planctomycetes bacterium]|nr:ATP-binding cassette domain-containing protein [Planctomycetota bacterium]
LSDYQRTLFRRKRIGIVFQQFNLLPGLNARENVALPLLVDGADSADIRRKTDELLEIIHLQGRANHLPQALSGGEQQRLAIARALINNPAVILADEPTGNLDSRHSVEIWQLLRRLATDQQVTIVLVSHEAQGASYADRVCVLHDGKLLGEIVPERIDDAALVAARYQELTG